MGAVLTGTCLWNSCAGAGMHLAYGVADLGTVQGFKEIMRVNGAGTACAYDN